MIELEVGTVAWEAARAERAEARAEAAEKALAELEATLVQEDTAEIQLLKARIEDTKKDSADAWNQRNTIYAELVKVQARAEAADAALSTARAEALEKAATRVYGVVIDQCAARGHWPDAHAIAFCVSNEIRALKDKQP